MNATLITGASDGIGKAIAREFASLKHNLVLVARNKERLATLCEELKSKYQIRAHYIVADLTKPEAPGALFEECRQRSISVDVLINNAGKGSSGEFFQNDLEAELEIIRLNNSSLVALTHLFLPEMIRNKKGFIINVASMIAFFPSPYMAVYAGSKHFVKAFTYSITEECRPYGVNVLLFSPGLTTSNFMNTKANNNDWGKVLVQGSNTQTPEQVAKELVSAYKRNKTFHVSGSRNRVFAILAAHLSPGFIARSFAKQKRKQIGWKQFM
ncbi:SDR family oxidoreductase [uncultured Fluviicola sp.]|uniref:SDR family NAD(P)-dependent oxidoreductase n=1 Tax=uncultured Fluviicola sp. TaxID=463303 RepID=UPI0025D21DAD|nr:SDR family oxidoreductase [uncultured Fluviicola sp.]